MQYLRVVRRTNRLRRQPAQGVLAEAPEAHQFS